MRHNIWLFIKKELLLCYLAYDSCIYASVLTYEQPVGIFISLSDL